MEEKRICVHYNVEMTMRDGVKLCGNVYGPEDDRPYPAILLRLPYGKDSFEHDWGWLNPLPLARAGYRVVIQDCRGVGASEGRMDFDKVCQQNDGYDSVEWIAAQSWCDGNVGMYGLSYFGFTQLLAAEARPPHLKAICPWEQTGLYKYSGGFTTGSLHLVWLLERCRDWLLSESCDLELGVREKALRQVKYYLNHVGEVAGYFPQGENPAAQIEGLPILRDYLRRIREYDDPACPAREGRPIDFSRIDIPCFFLGGWYDETSKNGPVENWMSIGELPGGQERLKKCRMIMGPWNHGCGLPRNVGVRSFGNEADHPMGRSITELLIRWFDFCLKGVDDGISEEPPIMLFAMGDNQWRYEEAWPVPGVSSRKLYLESDGAASENGGKLSEAVPAGGSDHYTYDPMNPVPSRVPGISSECQEQTPLEEREDVLAYTSAVLAEKVEVTGEPVVELYVSSDCPDTDFMCKLTEVFPGGNSVNITDGAVRVSYNNTYERKLLAPGEIRKVTVRLGNTCNVFQKGSRIRLTVCSSGFPKYDINYNTADRIGAAANWAIAHNAVHFGGEYPSGLILPVRCG